MYYIDNVRGNFTGHRTHVKSLCIELTIPQTTTAATQVYLNQDINATQLNGKIITQIIVNTPEDIISTPANIGGSLKSYNTGIFTMLNTPGMVLYGYTLTLANKNKTLIYDYPLVNMISTAPSTGVTPINRTPRVYKFFNVEISAEESYISTFDPTQVINTTNIVSLEFFYIDKK